MKKTTLILETVHPGGVEDRRDNERAVIHDQTPRLFLIKERFPIRSPPGTLQNALLCNCDNELFVYTYAAVYSSRTRRSILIVELCGLNISVY